MGVDAMLRWKRRSLAYGDELLKATGGICLSSAYIQYCLLIDISDEYRFNDGKSKMDQP